MRVCLTVKSRYRFIEDKTAEKAKQEVEFALTDIDFVIRAVFDVYEMKVDVEYDDEDEDFDVQELIRAIQEWGKFQVVGVN